MRLILAWVLCTAPATGCILAEEPAESLVVTAEPVIVGPGAERLLCFSHAVDNDAPLRFEHIELERGPAWHHSGWLVVHEELFPGPDGYFECDLRRYSPIVASRHGTALMVQEGPAVQQLADPLELPPRSMLIGELHFLNLTDTDQLADATLTLMAEPAATSD